MRAVLIEAGKIIYGETGDPSLGDEEVLVRVASAGINAADLLQVAGSYPPPWGVRHDIPGLEFAGVAIAQGEKVPTSFIGKRVMAIAGGAAQAELISVHHSSLIEVPPQVPLCDAGGIPEAYLTAYDALWDQGKLSIGQRVLISGATGGVGSAASSLAVVAGAMTFGTSRTEVGRKYLSSLGVHALDPLEILGAGPFDIVLELVGGRHFHACLSELRSQGTIVIIGVGDQSRTDLDMRLVMMKRANVRGSTLRARPQSEKAQLSRTFADRIVPHFATGTLTAKISKLYDAHDAARAYGDFATAPKLGKLVLQFDASLQ